MDKCKTCGKDIVIVEIDDWDENPTVEPGECPRVVKFTGRTYPDDASYDACVRYNEGDVE